MSKNKVNKVVLAYSGGLDTSVILKWLEDEYGCEVVTFTADVGQGEEVEPARAKAQAMGIKEIYIEDLREEFARDYVFPMFRANAIYEGEYLLGTSIARPLIAKRLVEIARETGADAISHGATGKGNDQVRFELGAYALMPDVKIIAPWREWDLLSREKLMNYAAEHGIDVDFAKAGKKSPYSMDANLLHISYEGDILEDPWNEPEEDMWRWTVSPEKAPDEPTYVELTYEKGDIVAIDGQAMSAAAVMEYLNKVGGENGVGRDDIVENRFVGMKSRGCYETPAGTIMLKAHRAMESLTLDREAAHLKDELMPRYAKMIYNGFWWAPERQALQALIDQTQEVVNGVVRVKLYKGNVIVAGRKSDTNSLFDEAIATFDDDEGAYDQKDAEGFIKLNALRLRVAARKAK
ncbi:argininosuccinate synthase [Thiolapillus brandeum]|uniref:Argininosuccinate synthase n=1 Tax=Thiolapillus brandeum TaxID=1076588 RepID=A0A7U6GKF5_9GAMM|nr:argininosuccinate synthase [Thiolapillus brandeum]BAO45285.1 argininosuccinate synthase [Thiolapillus brandeum]